MNTQKKNFFIQVFLFISITTYFITPVLSQDWPGKWSGDTHIFRYDEGVLSYRDDGISGQGTISLKYSAPNTGYLIWDFGTIFITPPTSQNNFSLTLLSIQKDQILYRYTIAPDASGRELILTKIIYQNEGGAPKEISRRVLDRHRLRYASTAWNGLVVRIIYKEGEGIAMQSFSPHGDLQSSETIIEIDEGIPQWEMTLSTRFTGKKKLDHAFLLPRVTDQPSSEEDESLKTLDSKVDELGIVTLKLNKAVNTSEATVTCEGHHPTISSGESPNIIVIHLGAAFQPNTRYLFRVTGLRNLQGKEEYLEFEVMGSNESESSIEIPQGILITEIMADPPVSGPLKECRYIELFNNTGGEIDIAEITLHYRSTKYRLPHFKCPHGSFVILFPEGSPRPTLSATLVPMDNFPALNGTFTLKITGSDDQTLDMVNFSGKLYGEGAPHGSASVERIAYHPDLWRRSNHPNGGTPGLHTTMLPYSEVEEHAVVINEIMLTPSGTGEKYIELYNRSSKSITVSDLYLSYANKEETTNAKSWTIVHSPIQLPPSGYLVLCPFPERLAQLYPQHDSSTFIERIDFPGISANYSEIELKSHKDDKVIDRVIFRRQWLGENSNDRTGYSLERISPDNNGTQRNSWKRARSIDPDAKIGGTPGMKNSVFGTSPDHPGNGTFTNWPDTPEITLEQLDGMLQTFGSKAELELYTLDGAPIYYARNNAVREMMNRIQHGQAPFPTLLISIRITFTDEDREPSRVTYSGIWLHHIKR